MRNEFVSGSRMRPAALLVLCSCGLLPYNVPEPGTSTDADTDSDTDTDTDADTDSDSDSDTDTDTTGGCTPPDLWDLGAQGAQGGAFSPTYIGVHMSGIVENGDVLDFEFDGADASAWVVFTFYNATPAPMCSVIFDGSDTLTPTGSPATPSGQAIFESWDFSAQANDGWTDCGTFNGGDPRNWITGRSWTIALGEMVDSTTTLRNAIEAQYPGTWAADWQPSVFATFLDVGAANAVEVGWVFQFDHTCYSLKSGVLAENKPTGPLDAWVGNPGDWTVLSISALP